MKPIEYLLFNLADDLLILGHRNSEWTGIGPVLEEDIAFASMAQDKIGQAQALYAILHEEFNHPNPDLLAFSRKENDFYSCHFVEYPIGEYDFSLVRHFLFDYAQYIRFEALKQSTFEPLRQLSFKYTGEIKYHLMHADIWMEQLINGNEESKARIQSNIKYLWPIAHSMFETFSCEEKLVKGGVYPGEKELLKKWSKVIIEKCNQWGVTLNNINIENNGGRAKLHTEHLAPLLQEMTEVFCIDPDAQW